MEIDYKKEYEAMVQRARELHETGNELTKRQMEIVFPELRESEDEEIRKHIIDLVKDNAKAKSIPCDAEITYLEKQRELPFVKDVVLGYPGLYYYDGERMHFQGNPAMEEKQKESLHIPETCKDNADSFTDGIIEVRSFQRGIEEGRRREKQKEQTSDIILKAFENSKTDYSLEEREEASDYSEKVLPTSIACGESDEEFLLHKVIEAAYIAGQKEQKPPIAGNDFGWIDELKHDLEHQEELDQKVDDVLKQRKGIMALEWSKEDQKSLNRAINICISDFGEDSETARFLKSLPERFILQPKQEWSEEDKLMCKRCIADLVYLTEHEPEHKERYDAQIAWLKSHRPPQYCEDCKLKRSVENWKPSEEQMRVLKQVEDRVAMKSGYLEQVLDSLYCDLQKL